MTDSSARQRWIVAAAVLETATQTADAVLLEGGAHLDRRRDTPARCIRIGAGVHRERLELVA